MERSEFDVVRARKFEIVDEAGRVRAYVGPGPEGQTGVQFYDSHGEVRAELSVEDDGLAMFSLRGRSGEDIAQLSVGEGTPTISLTHRSGGDSWGVGLIGPDPEDRETQQGSLLLSEGGSARLVVTLLGAEGDPAILMRAGEDLVRVVP